MLDSRVRDVPYTPVIIVCATTSSIATGLGAHVRLTPGIGIYPVAVMGQHSPSLTECVGMIGSGTDQ